ncbi:TetR family transcriptional regulator [Streptomyces sp. NPDC046876]|uniref:TetR family transcriptional regulator n=1 Tax=Streptomyces sp. NPDC046876 TaxID=3155616 RepID=UPI0033C6FC1D
MAQQERALRTYESVLDSAAGEFARRGYAGANLDRIAAGTGLTKGALYGHFSSKGELATELSRQFEHGWHRLLSAAEDSPQSPLCTLDALMLRLAQRTEHDVRFRAGMRLAVEEACVRDDLPAAHHRLATLVSRLVRDAQQAGELCRQHSPETLSRLTLALLHGLHTGTGRKSVPPDHSRALWEALSAPWRTRPGVRRCSAQPVAHRAVAGAPG